MCFPPSLSTETCSKRKVKSYVDGKNKNIISDLGMNPEDNLKSNESAYTVVMNLVLHLNRRLS
jgi:hypothetical protein